VCCVTCVELFVCLCLLLCATVWGCILEYIYWKPSVLWSGVGFYNSVPNSLTQPLAQAKNGDEQV